MSQNAHPLAKDIWSFLEAIATPESATEDRDHFLRYALRLCPGLLTKAFNKAAVPLERHQRPALEFAEKAKLADIGQNWHLPAGLDAPTIEAYALVLRWATQQGRITADRYNQRLSVLCQTLEDLNPVLATLTYDRRDCLRMFDVALGVTSGFNADDIQFFLDGNYYSLAMQNRDYARQNNLAKQVTGVDMFWVPSPKTLHRIITQRKP